MHSNYVTSVPEPLCTHVCVCLNVLLCRLVFFLSSTCTLAVPANQAVIPVGAYNSQGKPGSQRKTR